MNLSPFKQGSNPMSLHIYVHCTLSPMFPASSCVLSHEVNSSRLWWNWPSPSTWRHSKRTQNQLQSLTLIMVQRFIRYDLGSYLPRLQWSIQYGCSLKIFLEKTFTTTPTTDWESSRVNIPPVFKMKLADLWKHLDNIVACASNIKICVI